MKYDHDRKILIDMESLLCTFLVQIFIQFENFTFFRKNMFTIGAESSCPVESGI